LWLTAHWPLGVSIRIPVGCGWIWAMAGDNPCFEAGLCQTRGRNRPTSGSTHTTKPAFHFCPTHQGPMHGTGRRECETAAAPRNRRRLRVRPTSSLGTRQNQPPAAGSGAAALRSGSSTSSPRLLMTAEQEGREVQVRALDGRSTVVKLPLGGSVRDLKAALRTSFPPAQVAPSFHLFLKVPRNSLPLPTSSFPACANTVSLRHGIDASLG
jgi:hypothetical protein